MRIARIPKIGIVVLAVLAFPSAASAAPPSPNPGQGRPGVIADWLDRLNSAHDKLKAADWKRGAAIADSVLDDMRNRIAGGEGTASLLAVALLYRAIGEAGLGQLHAAGWDFGSAQVFYPAYSRVDLKPYGKAGEALDPWRYNGSSPATAARAAIPTGQQGVEPPRKIRGDPPAYPSAKRYACVHGPIVVQSIISEEGRLEFPYLLTSVDPILGLAALDAVRDWRFRPAQLEGRPVRVNFILTVNFKLPVCG